MSDEMKEWKKQLLSDRKNGYDQMSGGSGRHGGILRRL